jgi:hypothetical protein
LSFLQNFQEDVFISYSSTDDEPLYGTEEGWVTHLHRDLEGRLKQLLSRQLKVWRDDENLQGNDELTPTLIEQLRKTGVLLSIVSPPYFESKWCMKEFRIFCVHASQHGGLRVENKSRLFKVVKTPVERSAQPPEMRDLVSFDFYEKTKTGSTLEYTGEYGDRKKYARKVNDLAYGIANFLRILSGQLKGFAPRATVYLAETAPDMKEAREDIWRDLLQRGFAVLPDEELSPDDANFETKVKVLLGQSDLSIHLIGEGYGDVVKAGSTSAVAAQAGLAAERCSDASFRRVIWLPPGIEASDPRQRDFLETLQNDSAAQHGTELLQGKIEDLKTFLNDWLAAKENSERAASSKINGKRGPLRLYMIADAQDISSGATRPLEDFFFDRGLEVIVSGEGEDETQIREIHFEHLRLCDACLIFYGMGSNLWLESKRNDLRRIVDGRADPVRAKVIYIAPPANEHKQKFRTLEAMVLRNTGDFSPAVFQPLLEALRKAPR